MQVDASVRFISDERGDDSFFFGAGFAYRIDRHEDKYKLIGADGEVNSDDDDEKKVDSSQEYLVKRERIRETKS